MYQSHVRSCSAVAFGLLMVIYCSSSVRVCVCMRERALNTMWEDEPAHTLFERGRGGMEARGERKREGLKIISIDPL